MKAIAGTAIFAIFLLILFLVMSNRDVYLETEERLYQGYAYDTTGNFEQALTEYDEAIRLNPKYPEAYSYRGAIYDHLSQHQRAIRDFDEALKLNPQLATAYRNRGRAYYNLGQYERASRDFDEAIKLDPQDALTYTHRGDFFLNDGRLLEAIDEYDAAISLNPNLTAAYANRAMGHALLGNDVEAEQDIARARKQGMVRAELEDAIEQAKRRRQDPVY